MGVQIAPAAGADESTWEQQYQARLRTVGRLRPEAERELRSCTDRAFAHLNPKQGAGGFHAGAVVGAVQAGKTGLMINLAARAFDQGFDIVLVLAGLRDDLRTQTALRFVSDLLQRGDPVKDAPGLYTHAKGKGYHGARSDCWSPRYDEDVNHDEAFVHLFGSSLERQRRVLAVAKKNVATLNQLRIALEHGASLAEHRSLSVLILDDECDEASVSGDPEAPTPDRIAELWAGLPFYVAYVGFTATPAANLLQETTSRLFLRDFCITLRTPGIAESTLTYPEPDFERRYTGGYAFYEMLEDAQRRNFLVDATMSGDEFEGRAGADQTLATALVAYYVGGAIRLELQTGTRLGDAARLPRPHTMLAHTESRVEEHWDLCTRVVRLTRQKGGRTAEFGENIRRVAPESRLEAADLDSWLANETEAWRGWYDRFRQSRDELFQLSPDRIEAEFPSWDVVRHRLPEVFRNTKLRVVNSDDSSADTPLQFQSFFSNTGTSLPTDVYSIIIGGNRLSRGLTIEGLCISYYTRAPLVFMEDTTVQRERWYGYRGPHLEFCRLFTDATLAIRLRRFHEHDEDLRRQLAWNITHGRAPVDATLRFLTLQDSFPTAKLGRGLGPQEIEVSGSRIFVDRVQVGDAVEERAAAYANERLAFALTERAMDSGSELRSDSGDIVGYILRDVAGAEVAEILDGLTYSFHNPDPERGVGWNLKNYYRRPVSHLPVTRSTLPPRSDPYLVSAYLKYWGAAHQECQADPRTNTYRAPDAISKWKSCPMPSFNVVVRRGSLMPAPGSPFRLQLLDREVDKVGVLGSRWGGRGYGSPGDEWIDVHPPSGDVSDPRSHDLPGLLLLHIVARNARGRSENGETYIYDRPCVGLVIPEGGPCIRFVLAETP